MSKVRMRVVALVSATMSSWSVLKFFGWVGYYSAYFGEPGMQSALKQAHAWALFYFWMAIFLAVLAAFVLGRAMEVPKDGIVAMRYMAPVLMVLVFIGFGVVVCGVWWPLLDRHLHAVRH